MNKDEIKQILIENIRKLSERELNELYTVLVEELNIREVNKFNDEEEYE